MRVLKFWIVFFLNKTKTYVDLQNVNKLLRNFNMFLLEIKHDQTIEM